MIIHCKTTLLAAEPTFVGTRIGIRLADDLTIALAEFTLAEGHNALTVSWGDGQSDVLTSIDNLAHAYSAAGDYDIRLSDDIEALVVIGGEEEMVAAYAAKIFSFRSNANNLRSSPSQSFSGCRNLQTLDFRESGLSKFGSRTFLGCSGLSGELYFPKVDTISGRAGACPFEGCTGGITKIHFAKINEEHITSTSAYKSDHTLGTGTATVVFDP